MIPSFFPFVQGERYAEGVPLAQLAQDYGTPLYVYSRRALIERYQAFDQAFDFIDHQVCFAVKANSNLAVLQTLAQQGAGFDIVSGGELERVLAAGGNPAKVVFSGLGKTAQEIRRALEVGIACFNVESVAELDLIDAVACELGKRAPVSLRVNPDVDPQTHAYISTGLKNNKFGVASDIAIETYLRAASLPGLAVVGIDCHIGSQITQTTPFADALHKIKTFIQTLAEHGITLSHIDIGGGLGVQYHDETPPTVEDYAQALKTDLLELGLKVYMEPGRAICANAGVLLTRVQLLKPGEHKQFAIVDAAMNDLMRPSLYQAWMNIVPIKTPITEPQLWDIVGAVCESGDWLGKDRLLALEPNDVLAVEGAGAYGFTMSSNYNTRCRAAEVMVQGEQHWLVRERETLASLWALEKTLPAELAHAD